MYKHSGYNSARIPSFNDYNEAKAHYEAVIPIRGRQPEIRPLGKNRRFTWYEIVKNRIAIDGGVDNPLGTFADSYACRLYNTNCVEFFPDGKIAIRVNGWKGPTTMGFLTFSLAQFGSVISASGKWYFQNKKGLDYALPTSKNDALIIEQNEDGYFYPAMDRVVPEYKHIIKRKELGRIKRCYTQFIDYARTMFGIDDAVETINYKDIGFGSMRLMGNGHWSSDAAENRNHLLQKIMQAQTNNDLDLMFKLACYCGYAFGNYSYMGKQRCSSKQFEEGFANVLKFEHKDLVFEKVEQPVGKAFIDRNAKFVQ